jgi:hypothetical protein
MTMTYNLKIFLFNNKDSKLYLNRKSNLKDQNALYIRTFGDNTFFVCVALGIKIRASHMLGKCFITELHCQPENLLNLKMYTFQ